MDTLEISNAQIVEITSAGRYIGTTQIGTKTAQLYFFNKQHYIIWYKRSVNFVSVHKVEPVSEHTAEMLFGKVLST